MVHRPGSRYQAPDATSRLLKRTEGEEGARIDDEVFFFDVEAGTILPMMMVEHQSMPMPSLIALKDFQKVDLSCGDLTKMIG